MPKRRMRYNIKMRVPNSTDNWTSIHNAKAKDARTFIMNGMDKMYNYPMEVGATQRMLHDLRTIKRRSHYNKMILHNVLVEGIYF